MTQNPSPTSSGPHVWPNHAWLAQQPAEEALEAELPIIDPHHHLWDREAYIYLLDEFARDLRCGHNVRATVAIESHTGYRKDGPPELRPVGEVELLRKVAETALEQPGSPRICDGIVGYADLTLGAGVQAVLEACMEAGGHRFKGIRNISAWHPNEAIAGSFVRPPEGLMARASFREGFACLSKFGLSFDAWLFHTQMDELAALARQFPDTVMVLGHIGGPIGIGPYADLREETFEDWRRAIARLSKYSNVQVKFSGLGMRVIGYGLHLRSQPPSSDELSRLWQKYFDVCLECFGSGRLMFASNFPVDKASFNYGVLWNAFKLLSRQNTSGEKRKMFFSNAKEVYNLTEV